MPVDQEPDQPISMAVPVTLEGGKQLLHLCIGQVLPNPIGAVRQPATGRITPVSVLPKQAQLSTTLLASQYRGE